MNEAFFGAMTLALAAGCGGKVVFEQASGASGATGGDGGSGGTSSVTSTGVGAFGGSFVTSSVGATSTSVTASSAESTSASSSSASGGTSGCPTVFPGLEAPCQGEGQICQVPGSCCGQAVCKGGLWTGEGPFCNMACGPECGPNGFACQIGYVCVVELSFSTIYKCEKNPCAGAPSCSCAQQLCQADGYVCNNTMGEQIYCDCPNC